MWETCIKELHEKWLPAHWRKDSHSLLDTSFIYSVFCGSFLEVVVLPMTPKPTSPFPKSPFSKIAYLVIFYYGVISVALDSSLDFE